jgi:6-phosphofructokinase 1
MKPVSRIGLFTSGGDAPGMNACIRAVVRAALHRRREVYGILHGYDGMIRNEIVPLVSHFVSNIIHRGGTILKTARSKEFMTQRGMRTAYENLRSHGIDALVAIGGDGTFRGALEFDRKYKIPVVGIPGTIDNDLAGTELTLGFDTAVNTALQAIDRIKDTAASHDRLFFVEVMGRDSGFIALWSGLAGGAEEILLPETKTDMDRLVRLLRERRRQGKSTLVVVAEGDEIGGALEIARQVKRRIRNIDSRVTILGHLQRGGSPTALDRILAARFGITAVEALLAGKSRVMTGILRNEIVLTPMKKAVASSRKPGKNLIRYIRILSI